MRFLKKKFLFIIKSLIQALFKLTYGSINSKSKFTHDKNIIKTKITIDNKNHYVYQIKNGRVYTDYVENVAVIKSKNIIENISYQQIKGRLLPVKYNSTLKKGTPRFKKYFKGLVVSLIQGASGNNNYFHWMFDILPRLYLISKVIRLADVDFFYIPDAKPYQLYTLSKFKIFKNRIINSKNYRHITADKIYATSHPWYHKGYILKEAKKLQPWILNWVSKNFIIHKKKFKCANKIFIDRSESIFNHCQFINNDQIIKFLKDKDFSIIQPGKLSVAKQIYLFNNAKVIIGAHGAAFANLVFCKPGTKIIEVMPIKHPNEVSKTISKEKKLNYNLIKTKNLNNKKNGDIYLPINVLKKYL